MKLIRKIIISSCVLFGFSANAQMIENFETAAAWMWAPWLQAGAGAPGTKIPAAAYTGAFGWSAPTGFPWPWHYRTDVVVGNTGNMLGAWAKGNQRNYLGFGATGGGSWSLVLAPNTSQLIIQDNAGWGYIDLVSAPYVYNTANWYYLEITWNSPTNVTGRLFDAGMVLQTSVNTNIATLAPGGVSFRSYCTTTCYFDDINSNVPLSVNLLEFTGTGNEEAHRNELSWTTGNEENNEWFIVEKSIDGTHYSEIGKVQGAGNSRVIKEYAFNDAEPFNGTNYYRLRQVEFDGTVHTSNAIAIEGKSREAFVQVFPSVSNGIVNVQANKNLSGSIQVSDVSGKIVLEKEISAETKNSQSVDLSSLNNGLYYIRVIGDVQSEMKKVVLIRN